MDSAEERALRQLRIEFVRRLDVDDYVLDYIEQEGGLSDLKCERIREKASSSRSHAAEALIDAVLQKSIVSTFLEALKCGGSHLHLAKLLSDKIATIKRQSEVQSGDYPRSGVPELNTDYSFGSALKSGTESGVVQDRSTTSALYDPDATCVMKVSGDLQIDGGGRESQGQHRVIVNLDEEGKETIKYGLRERTCNNFLVSHVTENRRETVQVETERKVSEDIQSTSQQETIVNDEDDSENEKKEIIHPQPKRVDIMDKKKRTLTKIHYHLKLLSHDGQHIKFSDFITKYKKRFHGDADIMFTLLDAEVESRRLVYDKGLHKGDIFNDLENCIIASSHPMANTVMFLARKGSARTMKESLEVGLEMLEEARALSGRIQPCKDTGMVLYILINILIQMYEKKPCLKLKQRIIATIDEAINDHFAESPSFLREDYTRMMYLKMVFCYLGIGLFGNTITGCDVGTADVQSAKACLEIIDRSKPIFDSRREMFYYMAKSMLCKKLGQHKTALDHAETAKRKAKQCGFKKELGPIMELTGDLEKAVAEEGDKESSMRELEIESELNDLEKEKDLVRMVLKKPTNQWGCS